MRGMDIPEGYDPNSLLARFEWKHLQTSARRHARERNRRMLIVGLLTDSKWHYHIIAGPPA